MREFKCRPFGDITVDLDDPETYSHLSDIADELDMLMYSEIGKAICYMDFWFQDVFPKEYPEFPHEELVGYQQRHRVYKLIEDFTNNRKNNYNNIMWYKEQVFLLQDETENMC